MCQRPRARAFLLLLLLALIAPPARSQQARDDGIATDDPDQLVALLVGDNLPFSVQTVGGADSRAWRAALRLLKRKDDAIPALTRGLASGDRLVRLNSVFVLRRIDTPATLPVRIRAATDAAPDVRKEAVGSLPVYRDAAAREVVLRALRDPDAKVRRAAVARFEPGTESPDNAARYSAASDLIPLLDDPATRPITVVVLGKLRSNVAARPLLRILKDEDRLVRHAAAEALGLFGDTQVVPGMVAALGDEDQYVRMNLVRSLGTLGDLRATPALVGLLSDRELFVRRDAATALGQIGDVRAVPNLIRVLEDADDRVRSAAAEALGRIGDARAVEPLCRALARPGKVDTLVARALGRLRDPRAIRPLADAILAREPGSDGSKQALEVLGEFRHPDAVVALVGIVRDARDNLARHHAKIALGNLVGRSFRGEPDKVIADWWEENRADYLRPVPGP